MDRTSGRSSINREKVCPLLLRIFYKINQKHSEADFRFKREDTQPGEMQIYTWMDATLAELTKSIVQVAGDSVEDRDVRVVFSLVYPGKHGTNVVRPVGSTTSNSLSKDDSVTLRDIKLEAGDYLAVSLYYDK